MAKLAGQLQPSNLEKAAGDGCAGISIVLLKVHEQRRKTQKREMHWPAMTCIGRVSYASSTNFFSDYARSHSRQPYHGRRFRAMKSTTDNFLCRSQT